MRREGYGKGLDGKDLGHRGLGHKGLGHKNLKGRRSSCEDKTSVVALHLRCHLLFQRANTWWMVGTNNR